MPMKLNVCMCEKAKELDNLGFKLWYTYKAFSGGRQI